jgi:hypothetical protein
MLSILGTFGLVDINNKNKAQILIWKKRFVPAIKVQPSGIDKIKDKNRQEI